MEFYGRSRELAEMESLYEKSGFQMLILYGRRRVGKSFLLERFVREKEHIYFTAIENNPVQNLISFEDCIFDVFQSGSVHPHFASFEDALIYIGEQSKNRRMVVVIDEYPYLALGDSSISSVLQKVIDRDYVHRNLFLILCGSSISFMENEVLSEKSPLFGRRTGQIDLLPFGYEESALFVPGYSPQDKAICYGVTGGVAKYLSLFDPQKDVFENISDLYFSEIGYLYEEPHNLLRQEFVNTALYNSIITAIANGAVSSNEIAQKAGISTAALAQAMKKLIAVRIVKKEIPILRKGKRSITYVVNDGLYAFWYKFVQRGVTAISLGYGREYFETRVKPFINEYMGPVFERMCQVYAFKLSMRGEIDTAIYEIGKWIGTDNLLHEPCDIDVVGINRENHSAVIGECKFRNEPMDAGSVKKCIDRARLITGYNVGEYLMFSKEGYKKDVIDSLAGQSVRFFDMKDLYNIQ